MTYYLHSITDTNGTVLLQSRDLPELSIVGDTLEEALSLYATDMLETTLDIYMSENRAIPQPTAQQPGEVAMEIPPMVAIKVALYNEALNQGLRRYEVGKQLGWAPAQIERFFDVKHPSTFKTIEAVAGKLGKQLQISLA